MQQLPKKQTISLALTPRGGCIICGSAKAFGCAKYGGCSSIG
jgi:hypothetical protein